MRNFQSRMLGHLTAVSYQWFDSPVVLRNRVYFLAGLMFVISIVGVCAGTRYQAADFFALSACLALAILFKLYYTFRMVMKRSYNSIEGIVIRVQSRHKPGRFYQVILLLESGLTETLLLDKNWRVDEGETYKFFFQSGIGNLGAFLSMDSFLGAEKIEIKEKRFSNET